jgi:hypothetical protein
MLLGTHLRHWLSLPQPEDAREAFLPFSTSLRLALDPNAEFFFLEDLADSRYTHCR